MASITGAVSALASFAATVPGIKNSYDLAATPRQLSPSQLVAAMIDMGQNDSANWQTQTFLGGMPVVEFGVNQLLIVTSAEVMTYEKAAPTLETLMDSYMTTLKANPYLGSLTAPPIHKPTVVVHKSGTIQFGDITYYGIVIHHQMFIAM